MFHFLWIVLLSNFQGENPSWRESTMERVVLERIHPGGNPPWRESTLERASLERIRPGGNPPWKEPTLERAILEIIRHGENPPWRESTLERAILERIRPENPLWSEQFWRESALIGRVLVVFARSPGGALHRVTLFPTFFSTFFNVFFKQMFGFVHFDRGKCYVESFAKTK